jgi:hypothetical protein
MTRGGSGGTLGSRRLFRRGLLYSAIEVAGPSSVDDVAQSPPAIGADRQVRSEALGQLLANLPCPKCDILTKLRLQTAAKPLDCGRAESLSVQPDGRRRAAPPRPGRADVPESTRPWRLRVREVGEACGDMAAVGGRRVETWRGHRTPPEREEGAQPVAAPLGGLRPLY